MYRKVPSFSINVAPRNVKVIQTHWRLINRRRKSPRLALSSTPYVLHLDALTHLPIHTSSPHLISDHGAGLSLTTCLTFRS